MSVISPNEIRSAPVKYASQSQVNLTGQAVTSGEFHGAGLKGAKERLAYYRQFVYAKGGIRKDGKGRVKGIDLKAVERFRYRTRYFTDSGIIGTKAFVERIYQQFKGHFTSKHEKRPKVIHGLEGIFSLKRLSEAIL